MTIKFNADNKSNQCFTDEPEYSVKNVKSFMGMEGLGYECSLYLDGKKIGTVTDTANGGIADFYLEKGEKEKLDNYCKTLPKNEEYDIEVDCDIFLSELVDNFENEKRETTRFKRLCKTKTVYLLKDSPDSLWSIKYKYCKKIADKLRVKHGENLVEIINERYIK